MKKLLACLALILVCLLSSCKDEVPSVTVAPVAAEDVTVESDMVQPTEDEDPEIDEIIHDEAPSHTVEIQQLEGTAEYRGYSLDYVIESPVFTDFPEEAAEIMNSYYANLCAKYVSYLEDEVVYELENYQWDGEFSYYFGCDVTYLSDTLVSFLRTAEEPMQEAYFYSETFSLENGGLVTLDYLFGLDEEDYRDTILTYILDSISNDDELLPQLSQRDPDWKTTLSNQLDLTQFAVMNDGLCIYFQHNQLGLGVGFSILIPWENLPEAQK